MATPVDTNSVNDKIKAITINLGVHSNVLSSKDESYIESSQEKCDQEISIWQSHYLTFNMKD